MVVQRAPQLLPLGLLDGSCVGLLTRTLLHTAFITNEETFCSLHNIPWDRRFLQLCAKYRKEASVAMSSLHPYLQCDHLPLTKDVHLTWRFCCLC